MHLPRRLLDGSRPIDRHLVQNLVQQLQRTVQMYLYPARRLLDGLPWIIRTPSLDKGQPQNAQSSQVVHTDAGRR